MSKFMSHSNDQLIEHLKRVSGDEASQVSDCLLCIIEVRKRRLPAALGYSSIYKFLLTQFGFSKNQSYARIRAAEAVALVPEIEQAIRDRSTCFSYFASAMVAIYREGKRLRKQGEPSVQVPERKSFLLEILRTGDVEAAIARHFPELIGKTDFELTATDARVQYSLTATTAEVALIERVKQLLAHKIRDGSWHDVAIEVVEFFLSRRDPLLRVARLEPSLDSTKQRGHFTLATKKALLLRSEGQCEFVAHGRRCDARSPLEIDHILPIAHGGTDRFENLRILFSEHNRFEAFRKNLGFSR
jgi:HNH endonuclease